jgi:hypothetical protein
MQLSEGASEKGRRLAMVVAVVTFACLAFLLRAGAAHAALDPVGGDDRLPAVHQQAPAAKADTKAQGELAEVSNAAGEPLPVSDDACRQNLALAAQHDLQLPDGWKIYCVGPGLDWEGGSHWGVTCPYADCPEGAGPYVSISSPTYYVVAHELCHANFGNDELMADRCAAEHGASLATSPYS